MALSVYILKCAKEKYFIGKTEEPIKEIYKKHLNGTISEWTKLYKPLRIVCIISPACDFDEDKYTEMYMNKYGIDNVRGGKYNHINLDSGTVQYINNEILEEQDYNELSESIQQLDLTWDLVKDEYYQINDIKRSKKYNNKKSVLSYFKTLFSSK